MQNLNVAYVLYPIRKCKVLFICTFVKSGWKSGWFPLGPITACAQHKSRCKMFIPYYKSTRMGSKTNDECAIIWWICGYQISFCDLVTQLKSFIDDFYFFIHKIILCYVKNTLYKYNPNIFNRLKSVSKNPTSVESNKS